MRFGTIITYLCGVCLMSAAVRPLSAAPGASAPLIPAPASYRNLPGTVELGSARQLILGPGCGAADRTAAAELNLWLDEMGLEPLSVSDYRAGMDLRGAVLVGPPVDGSPLAAALASGEKVPAGEAYLLRAEDSRVLVAAADPAGRFYGLMSLAQLLRAGGGRAVPACLVQDRPALALRGASDDVSRGQISTLQDFKRLVRFLARYKMNLYMPYLEDMFQLKSRPDFGAGRGALTPETARELVAFAATLHVRVVPAFQTLGHYENFLLDPDNFPLAEFPGGQCLSPGEEEVYTFTGRALTELCAAFPDTLLNVGCDESWDVGRGKNRAQARREGLAAVHVGHYRRIYEQVRSLNRHMLMYGDILLSNPKAFQGEALPHDILIVDWHYNAAASYPSVARFRNAGYQVLVSPGLSNWSRFYPFWGTGLTNIENLTREGLHQGALGALTSSWCDFGAPNLRQNAAWGWAFAAACAWNPEQVERAGLERLFWRQFLGCDQPDQMLKLNDLLSGIGRSTFDDWWRHPLAGPSPRGMITLKKDATAWGNELKSRMAQARAALEALRPSARANGWFLDLCGLAAGMGELLGEKYIWMERAAAAGNGMLSPAAAKDLSASARRLRERTSALRDSYRELWLRFNRPEGLDNLLLLWDRQLLYWETISASLDQERRLPQWRPDGVWIAPQSSLAAKKLSRQRTAYYLAELELPAGADNVKLQLMGESQVEAWVNGRWAGRKVARWCLSEVVDRQRAVILDLTSLLRSGRNRLAFSVTNYEGRPPALHVCGEVYSGGKVIARPVSSTAWRAQEPTAEPEGWNTAAFSAENWPASGAFSYENPVSRPYFEQGLPSRVER